MLSDENLERYARQVIMPEVGEDGQERLLAARVLVVGAGAVDQLGLLALVGVGGIAGVVPCVRIAYMVSRLVPVMPCVCVSGFVLHTMYVSKVRGTVFNTMSDAIAITR